MPRATATMRWPSEPSRATRARSPRPPKQTPATIDVQAATTYEAAAQTRRTLGWHAPTSSPNSGLLGNLATLRDRSRAAVRNDGNAKSIIDHLVTNLIGTGIKPLSKADDAEFRQAVQARWLQWTDESDADGLLDWYGQQTQATRAWLEGGESFVRLRLRRPEDGLSVPLQVQVLEPELCPHNYTALLPNGHRVRAGIEFDGIGRRVAYYFHPSRASDWSDFDHSQLRRVPADSVVHLFDPLRPGQLRGVPHLTPALVKLWEVDKVDDATVLRQQLANLFVAFITRPTVTSDEALVHPLTGQTITGTDPPTLSFNPGIIQELAPGEEMQFSDPPKVGQEYQHFMRQQLMAACTAAGTPYEVVTGDMRGINDRVVRVILHEFRRRVQAWQHQILAFQLCRPVWRAWFDRAFLADALPLPASYATNPEPWSRVKWMPQGWPYIHPVQDVQAKTDEIRAGFTSRSAAVSEHGEDAEVIDAEQAADNARADELGLRYDSDGRQAETVSRRDTENADGEGAAPQTGATA